MKVSFHEIKDEDLVYNFNENTPWIMEVIGSLDERQDSIQRPPNWKPRSRPTEVSFTLRHVEDLVHVTAKVKTHLYLICSLCGETFQFPVHTHFHVLLTQSEMYSAVSREKSHKGAFSHEDLTAEEDDEDDFDEDDTFGDHDDDEDDAGAPMDFNSADFEISVVKEPIADLKEILHEQITLTLPMQPKHPEGECKGQVSDWSDSKEPLRENPFAVLKDFKKKS